MHFGLKLLVIGLAFTLFFFLPWLVLDGAGDNNVQMSWNIIDAGTSGWMSGYIIYSLLLGIVFIVMYLTKVGSVVGRQIAAAMALLGIILMAASVFGSDGLGKVTQALPMAGALAILNFLGITLLACGCHYKSFENRSVAASVLIGISGLLVILAYLIPVKVGLGGKSQMLLVSTIKMVFNPKGTGVPEDLRVIMVLLGLYNLALFLAALVSLIGAADMRRDSQSPSPFMTILYRYFQFYLPILLFFIFLLAAIGSDGRLIPLAVLWLGIGLLFLLELTIEGSRLVLAALEGTTPSPAPLPEPVPKPVPIPYPEPRPQPRPQPPAPPKPSVDFTQLPSDVQARLAKLEELKSKGIVSPAEYEDQKRHILSSFQ